MKMKKIFLSMMFSLFFAIGLFAQSGHCGAVGDGTNLTWSISDKVLTISGTGDMADSAPWQIYSQSIEGVIIDKAVTSIGSGAFSGCSSLTSITIPDAVTSIGESAFFGCSSLTSIIIPDGVTSIESNAFGHCSSLTSIIIPDGVTSIESNAFSNCSGLTSITIPAGVTSIGESAFYGCTSLASIIIPADVTSIGEFAFAECSSLVSIIIPNRVSSIERAAFSDCSSLANITIPDGVTSIGESAFWGCSSLTSIIIPNSVTSIGSGAFRGCSSLTSVTIPTGITSLGSTFYDCNSLTTINVYWEVPTSIYDLYLPSKGSITLVVPAGTKALYEMANAWKDFGTIIERAPNAVSVESVSLLPNSGAALLIGSILQITATVSPADATDKDLTWTSSNPAVATVNTLGEVTALSAGTTIITATTNDGGKTATLDVTVSELVAASVTLNIDDDIVIVGESLQLTATINPSYVSDATITWTSSDDAVASVDQTGKVTGLSEGTATITATTVNGVSASCVITVEEQQINDIVIDLPIDGANSMTITLELPAGGSATGSFAITLPAGMVIDLDNTTLSESLSEGLELVVTPLGNNTWVIEIVKPITPLSMQLRSATTFRQLVNIAYKVDESMAAGTYEVVLSDIDIRLSDGTNIVKDRMSTNVTVSSGITANELTSGTTAVTLSNGTLTVDTPNAETVKVFSVGGALVSTFAKSAGKEASAVSHLPNGIYVVTGSTGWSAKVLIK